MLSRSLWERVHSSAVNSERLLISHTIHHLLCGRRLCLSQDPLIIFWTSFFFFIIMFTQHWGHNTTLEAQLSDSYAVSLPLTSHFPSLLYLSAKGGFPSRAGSCPWLLTGWARQQQCKQGLHYALKTRGYSGGTCLCYNIYWMFTFPALNTET